MKLIVGLGNPGRQYERTRHNIGATVVKALAEGYKAGVRKDRKARAMSVVVGESEEKTMLALPLTYMNLSGEAVGALVRSYSIELADVLIVCDDIDLEFGRLRLRPSGGSGGHKGLVSIIGSLGSEHFCRLRVGVGRPPVAGEEVVSDFVLSGFLRQERPQVKKIVENACECCRTWIAQGITKSMNVFNKNEGAKDESV